jgi:hypothetical protein
MARAIGSLDQRPAPADPPAEPSTQASAAGSDRIVVAAPILALLELTPAPEY